MIKVGCYAEAPEACVRAFTLTIVRAQGDPLITLKH